MQPPDTLAALVDTCLVDALPAHVREAIDAALLRGAHPSLILTVARRSTGGPTGRAPTLWFAVEAYLSRYNRQPRPGPTKPA